MPLEMPFEMRNLTSFQMEKLCYDLKLEALKEMDAKDTIELAKVNAGFQSMLSRKPWLVFDHHVYRIDFGQGEVIWLKKFPDSSWFKLDATHLPLRKRVHSGDKLWLDKRNEQLSDEQTTFLNQLNAVKYLHLFLRRNECLLKFLENFRSMIVESADIGVNIDLFKGNQVISELFENFFANQVNGCEKVWFYCHSVAEFHFYYDAFAKTSIQFLRMPTKMDHFEEIMQSIIKKRIPSKNLKAAFLVEADLNQEMDARIVNFLSQFPGMKRFDGENHQEVFKMANELLKENAGDLGENAGYSLDFFGEFFRRNIDSSMDCVYMLHGDDKNYLFFAFYVQPQ